MIQDEAEYRKTHHTESDTVDKVYPDEINQGAKVLAAWAYNVAMLPDVLPRNPKPRQPGDASTPPSSASPATRRRRRPATAASPPERRVEDARRRPIARTR